MRNIGFYSGVNTGFTLNSGGILAYTKRQGILPFTLLRRLECVLEPTRDKVLAAAKANADKTDAVSDKLLLRAAEQQFFNLQGLKLIPGLSGHAFGRDLKRVVALSN